MLWIHLVLCQLYRTVRSQKVVEKNLHSQRNVREFYSGSEKNDIWRNMSKSYIFTHQARKLSEKTAVSGP